MPITAIYVAAAMLFLGAVPLPYGYYMLLRVVATVLFAWGAYVAHDRGEETLPWMLGGLAVLFNPLISIHLTKEIWAAVDIAAAVFLVLNKNRIKEREAKELSSSG